jgi:hypothetical protein
MVETSMSGSGEGLGWATGPGYSTINRLCARGMLPGFGGFGGHKPISAAAPLAGPAPFGGAQGRRGGSGGGAIGGLGGWG